MSKNKNQTAQPPGPAPAAVKQPPAPPAPPVPPEKEPPAPAAGQEEDRVVVVPPGQYTAEELAELARMESEGGAPGSAAHDEDEDLNGEEDAAAQKADELALLGSLTPLERAKLAFGLEDRHILGSGVKTLEDGTVQVTIVTHGGQRVRWPQDSGRVLSDMEKGDGAPTPVPAGIMPASK